MVTDLDQVMELAPMDHDRWQEVYHDYLRALSEYEGSLTEESDFQRGGREELRQLTHCLELLRTMAPRFCERHHI